MKRHRWSLLIIAVVLLVVVLSSQDTHADSNWTRDNGLEYLCAPSRVQQVANMGRADVETSMRVVCSDGRVFRKN